MDKMNFSKKNTGEASKAAERRSGSDSPEYERSPVERRSRSYSPEYERSLVERRSGSDSPEYERPPVLHMPTYKDLQKEIDISSFALSTSRLMEIYNTCKDNQEINKQVSSNEKSLLLNKIYLAMMYHIDERITFFPFDWVHKQYEHVTLPETLNSKIVEFKKSHQDLKIAYGEELKKTSEYINNKTNYKLEDIYEIIKCANYVREPLDLNADLQRFVGVLIPSMKREGASLSGRGCMRRNQVRHEAILPRFTRTCSESGR